MFSSRSHAVAAAMDRINDKYGEFVITPALMMGMDDTIIDRIAFGGARNWKNCICPNYLLKPSPEGMESPTARVFAFHDVDVGKSSWCREWQKVVSTPAIMLGMDETILIPHRLRG